MIGYSETGWRLLLFVALQRLTPLRAVLLATGLITSLVLPLRLTPARTFTVTVTVMGIERASSIAAIEVYAGNCLLAEAPPSPIGATAFALPPGDYTVSARTNTDSREAGWAMDRVAMRLDRDLDVAIDHQLVPQSDLDSMRAAPPAHCPAL